MIPSALEWIAHSIVAFDPKFSTLLQLIEASPSSLTPQLETAITTGIGSFAGINQVDGTGTTLLHAAWYTTLVIFLIWPSHSGNFELVKWLLSHGANLEAVDRHGWTALIYALSNGHTKVYYLKRLH